MFSAGYYQTAPSTELFSPSWDTTAEGAQNFLEFADNGEPEEYAFYSQVTPRASSQDFDVKTEPTSVGGEVMGRQTSNATLKNRAIKIPSKSHSRIQTAYSSQAFLDGAHAPMVSFPDPENQMLYQPALSLGMVEAPPIGLVDPAQMSLDHQFDTLLVGSPESWDSVSSAGQSPRTLSPHAEDVWTPNSNISSPEIQSRSRLNKLETVSVMPVAADDLQGSAITTVPDNFSLSFASRRPSSEGETARDHPLYKNAFPSQVDGLYHCPWEGTSGCTHKPEKLKCNYDKFVDSHLKPYRCKIESCENAKFSSTACLLRHEREAHAMHGHGDKPYLCTYEGCDRAILGNGFPRQWNLKDHMRRVHNDNGSTRSASATSSNTKASSSKGRKRKSERESSSRKSSVKSTASDSRRTQQDAKQPLIKEWLEQYMALKESVQGMKQPDSMETLGAIKDIQDCLGRLSSISHNLVYSHGPRRFTQQSG